MESVAIVSYARKDSPAFLYMRSFHDDTLTSIHFLDQECSLLNEDEMNCTSDATEIYTSGASVSSQFRMMATMDAFDRLEDMDRKGQDSFHREVDHGSNVLYLGFITAIDDIRFYGYRTATQIRIVIGVKDNLPLSQTELLHQRDSAIKDALSNIHQTYINHLMNPFTIPGMPIKCKRFDDSIKNISCTIR